MPYRKEYGLSRRCAPRNDSGGGPCTRARALPSACHCEPVQNGNRGAPVRPGEGDAAKRLKPWLFSGKAGAKDAQLVSPRCGNPFSPQGNLASWLLFGQIRDALRIRLKRCFLPCTAAGVTDCPAASLLAMTCRGQRRFCVRKEVLPGESVTTFAFAPSTLFSLRLAELLTRPA